MGYRFLIFGLILFSCGRTVETKNENEHKNENADTSVFVEKGKQEESPALLKQIDFSNRVFDIGDATHFTDTCSFYFECDCCSGLLLFNKDSTFYYKDYCVTDISIGTGTYSIKNNLFSLNFDGRKVSDIYNMEYDLDSTVTEYTKRDTLIESLVTRYSLELCGNRKKLVNLDKSVIAIETSSDYQKEIYFLQNNGYLKRLNQLKR